METVTPRKSSPIPRQSLAAAVVERLREKILSGELREGEQLRQDAIAAEFQISRIPVREALSHLAAEGLITIVANRGAVVSALSPDEITQLFETRAVLECYMLRCAIANMKEEDFRRAEDILWHFEESLEKDSEVKSWGQWNWSFHSALYEPANRPVMPLLTNRKSCLPAQPAWPFCGREGDRRASQSEPGDTLSSTTQLLPIFPRRKSAPNLAPRLRGSRSC